MDAETLRQEWDAREHALIKCAQRAWAAEGLYELYSWECHDSHVIVAFGYPPRAKWEYQHAFLFERVPGTRAEYQLRSLGKAPWHRSIWWRGVCFTAKGVLFRSYPPHTWTTERS